MREKSWFREYGLILAAGVAVGIAALILTASGNPKNMGFCIACFLRDIAGALGLHSAANVQYIRPEIKFDSREALRLKMQEDIAAARAWFVKRAEEENKYAQKDR